MVINCVITDSTGAGRFAITDAKLKKIQYFIF